MRQLYSPSASLWGAHLPHKTGFGEKQDKTPCRQNVYTVSQMHKHNTFVSGPHPVYCAKIYLHDGERLCIMCFRCGMESHCVGGCFACAGHGKPFTSHDRRFNPVFLKIKYFLLYERPFSGAFLSNNVVCCYINPSRIFCQGVNGFSAFRHFRHFSTGRGPASREIPALNKTASGPVPQARRSGYYRDCPRGPSPSGSVPHGPRPGPAAAPTNRG